MDISIKSAILFITIVLTGLSAGLFFAWSVSVIPGTKKLTDMNYLETMQSINRAILNPAFFLIFFGSVVLLGIGSTMHYHENKLMFAALLLSAVVYLFGTFGVTAFGNVPMNNELDVLQLKEISAEKASEFRRYYETKWNRLHLIRTVFAVVSFSLSILSLFIQDRL